MTAYLDRQPRDFEDAAAEAEIARAGAPARNAPLTDAEADEALRLNDNGMFLLQLGALYRRDYAVVNKALAAARKRRADAWARAQSAARIVLPKRAKAPDQEVL